MFSVVKKNKKSYGSLRARLFGDDQKFSMIRGVRLCHLHTQSAHFCPGTQLQSSCGMYIGWSDSGLRAAAAAPQWELLCQGDHPKHPTGRGARARCVPQTKCVQVQMCMYPSSSRVDYKGDKESVEFGLKKKATMV